MREDRKGWAADKEASDLWSVLCAVGIAAGGTGIFFGLGRMPVMLLPVLAAAGAAMGLSAVNLIRKERAGGTLLGLFAAALLFFWSSPAVIRGIFGFADQFRIVWNQVFETYYGSFAAEYTKADVEKAGLVLGLLWTVLTGELIRRRWPALLTLAVFAPLCLGLGLGIRLPAWAAALLAAGWLGAWCSMSGPVRVSPGMVLLTGAAGLILCLFTFSGTGAGRLWQRNAAGFQSRVKQGVERLRFGEDLLPGGDLTRAGRMLTGTEDCLELTMEQTAPIYLRGYVGSVYGDNAWKPFGAEVYEGEYEGMLAWLAEQGFYPGAQYAGYEARSGREGSLVSVSVRNVGAGRRFLYLPETALLEERTDGTWLQDGAMKASGWFGKREYSFSYYDVQSNAELQKPDILPETEGDGFWQAERVYRAFVYDHYLELEEQQKTLLDTVFFRGDDGKDEGLYTVTSRIRTVLRILAEYKEEPKSVPQGEEFLGWFLQKGREGNAACYAAAAALAYRAAGIPARYAEGYVLTPEQAREAGGGPVILSGKNAHAWVEVYMDGAGWRAVEVTPGFYEERYEADVVLAVSSEEIRGSGSELAGLPVSEEYEPPEEEEKTGASAETKRGKTPKLFLLILAAFLAWRTAVLSQALYREYRYRRMDDGEKMRFLYGEIVRMMEKFWKDFCPERPLVLPDSGLPFDEALYERTVKRMEKMIYGEQKPKPGEVPAAEALAEQMKRALRREKRGTGPRTAAKARQTGRIRVRQY